MKAYMGSKKVQFPAVIRELQNTELEGKEIKVSNRYYLVGDSAATSMNMVIATPHIDPGFHGSSDQYIQMCYALERLGVSGTMDTLVCSLPYTDSRDRALKKQLRERRAFEWGIIDSEDREISRRATFQDVKLVPQGVGAMNQFQSQHAGRPKVVMLVDVGSCTTDVVSIKINNETGEYDYCHDACRSIENLNVTWFKDQWTTNLESEVRGIRRDKKYDYFGLMQHAIENDFTMQLGDRTIDARPAFDQTRDDFAEKLKPTLRRVAEDLWYELNTIIFTGGGTYLINFEKFDDRRIEKLDQWSNVIGQYHMYATKHDPLPMPSQVESIHEEDTVAAGAA